MEKSSRACWRCDWFAPTDLENGECRAHPPVLVPSLEEDALPESMFPIVRRDEWCKQYCYSAEAESRNRRVVQLKDS